MLLMLMLLPFYGCHQESAKPPLLVHEGALTFQVPGTWSRLGGKDMEELQSQVQAQGLEQAEMFEGVRPEDFRLDHVAVFAAGDGEITAAVIVTMLSIPPSVSNEYLDALYAGTKDEIPRRYAYVYTHRRTEVKGVPALEADVETGEGVRILSFTFWSRSTPGLAAGLFIRTAPGKFSKHHADIDSIISSLQVAFQP
jgi:hypothetical protein